MYPNANLDEQLELARDIQAGGDVDRHTHDAAQRLAELVLALDQWIKGGGFLPEAWLPPGRLSEQS